MSKFQIWLSGWVDILDGIITVLSFGNLSLGLSFKVCAWFSLHNARKDN